ncbi:MAG: hypothetical protein OXI30_20915 [Chloroflexota bacterium]|nr:hypothetical protein [Chloroflexota bacterium]
MKAKTYALVEPGGRQVRGFGNGNLVEVRYIDVVRTGIQSPDRDQFIQLVEQAQLSEEELRECRIGYVDDNGVGEYRSWQEFLDMTAASS